MKKVMNWYRIMYVAGVVAFLVGTLDPLEGSVIILAGSILLAVATYLKHDTQRWLFISAAGLMLFGIICMFYFSNLGGFGGSSTLSWWWSALIIPYPAGWLLIVITLIIRAVRKHRLSPG